VLLKLVLLLLVFLKLELQELLELLKLKLQLNLVSVVMEFVKELNNVILVINLPKEELFPFSKDYLAATHLANS